MKFYKILIFLTISAGIFAGCDDERVDTTPKTEAIPSDVSIDKPDANDSIDENLPPEPAIEDTQSPQK
ncbi:MAG: hypothetical protein LUC34_02630 [Campylobacter sp.]|nr:hypothetical protein [Campylobacter sp.]